ncbi:MAG TPA: hypothetical protein VKM96_04980 [Candidatus Bathyarchaeia archaeon]|nr:hypothetical protein [Candidatus Bathyarchaeia archaeon]
MLTTVRLAPVDTNTFPTDAVITHTPLTGTMMFPEYGDVIDPLHVTKGFEGEHPMGEFVQDVTVSGIDWTYVANWPCIVLNFSEYAAPALSWPVFDVKAGTAQIKTMADKAITMRTINTSA